MTDNLINNNPFAANDDEFRSFDGTGNNLANPEFGSAGSAIVDLAPLDYSNNFSTPAAEDRPNPRVISVYNENGSSPGFGRGGNFAKLDNGLDLTAENFDVV
ncbi:MAG TPA: peroxidase family protein [Xenococcaceae cyanobacterium]